MAKRGVYERQQDKRATDMLAAQRELYSRAKLWDVAESLVTVLLAAVSPVVVWLAPDTSQFLAAAAGVWLLAVRVIFRPRRRGHIRHGARMQEAFDVYAFDLRWNDALGRPPAPEDIDSWASRHQRKQHEPLSPWYAPTGGSLQRQVVVSQRMSVVWTRRLHRRFSLILASATGAWAVALIVIALWADLKLSVALVALLLPSLPALLEGVDRSSAHRDASHQAETIEHAARKVLSGSVTSDAARALQDEMYHLRVTLPLIPDRLYKSRRDEDERAMRYGADEFRSDA